jgi:plasmid rolling circle replication initiator protein Rep
MSNTIIAHEFGQVNIETVMGTGEILKDTSASGRERPWGKHKMSNIELTKLFEIARTIDETILTDSRMDSLRHCSDVVTFLQDAAGKRKLKSANFCRVRACPMCNWRGRMKLFSQVSAFTAMILAEKKARFIFVTLTVRNIQGHELSNTINKMNQAFKYLTSKGQTFALAKDLKKNLLGYMKAEEITYNSKTGTFHPHIHAIFEVKPSYFKNGYMRKKAWITLWRSALGVDYDPSIDVRNIKGGTAKAVAEVAKYPVKMDTVLKIKDKQQAALALIQLYRSIFGRRLVTFGGDFREYKRKLALDDIETGDLIHVETDQKGFNPIAQILFKYHADVGAYIC